MYGKSHVRDAIIFPFQMPCLALPWTGKKKDDDGHASSSAADDK
jgi:hypothetical protein